MTPPNAEPTVTLKPGREKPLTLRHPWIFGGAVARIDEGAADGVVALVRAADGRPLARGYVNRRSQIVVRVLTWEPEEAIDDAFWRGRIAAAARERDAMGMARGACRLINAEADGLPGLIVDRYGEWLVLQASTLGIERAKSAIVAALASLPGVRGIWERSDAESRKLEGLEERNGPLWGEAPPEWIEIEEAAADPDTAAAVGAAAGAGARPLRLLVDVRAGQKTGFYLDQRFNRRAVARWCGGGFEGGGAEVLNLFSYTGAFAAQALAAGARGVVNVDASAEALALARRNLELNGFAAPDGAFIEGNVFGVLRQMREEGRAFDVIVCDPPKFAATAAQIERAARAYKDLNLIAMQLLRPRGVLATFSCSGRISADLFQKIVFGAMIDARREARIVERLGQPPDHPVRLSFPEGEYLKGLVLRMDG